MDLKVSLLANFTHGGALIGPKISHLRAVLMFKNFDSICIGIRRQETRAHNNKR